jgi:hypothetical protein
MEVVMKPLALAKALVLVALAVGLEAGFLLQTSVPPREVILAARRASPAVVEAETPPAPTLARAPDARPAPRS